jgi:hypothetical protein
MLMMIKSTYTFFLLLLLLSGGLMAQVQTDLDNFNKERIHINKTGMTVLTCWSLANVAEGGIGYFSAKEGEAKYFHQMNGLWGIINVVFGATGLLQAIKDHRTYDFEKTLKQQQGIEKTFIANAALDLVYVSVGIYLKENAKVDLKRSEKYRGWGNSIIMQGAFLCLFDASMFIAHNHHNNKKLSPILRRATFTLNENGAGVMYRF